MTDDSIGTFLKEISRKPLLSDEEVILLSRQVQEVMKFAVPKKDSKVEVLMWPSFEQFVSASGLDSDEARKVYDRAVRARQTIVDRNLRLVVSIAKKYGRKDRDLDVLIQEGAMGLARAAEKFDHTLGYKFSTFAYWWIRQGITRYLSNSGRTIRIPVHLHESILRLKKFYREFLSENGRKPTDQEVMSGLEWSLDRLQVVKKARIPVLSLNCPVGEDVEFGDLVAGATDPAIDGLEASLMAEEVRARLDSIPAEELDDRAKLILKLRFGLEDGEPKTLYQVGEILGLSHGTVRRLQRNALSFLRRYTPMRPLKDYLN